ncbi:GNAT family N-acetyltransferase [Gordonia hankookensis]|uniref:GNAT family N-acetyltransferase n=1 Tax=Gordonia hankookensis TaxID=589403 RepID=UPI001942784B|nr:GNAT family N-acetyltransferase [Gordonia hankookensis]
MPAELSWSPDVPVLGDGVVTLRGHRSSDLGRIVEMATDPEMIRWTRVPTPYGRGDAEQFALDDIPRGWDEGTGMGWAIDHGGRYVGNVDIRGAGAIVDIGFALHPDARGLGVMQRSVRLAVDHAFGVGKRAVRWQAAVGNLPSLRVAHACGFTLDAVVRDGLEIGDAICDAWVATLRPDDSPAPKTTWHASTFDTERFRLRPLAERDDERVRDTLDDPVSRKYLFERPVPLTVEHAAAERLRKWWTAARGETCTWVVADLATDTYLGDITLLDIDAVTGAEAGFYTHPDARGGGVLAEAFPAVVDHAFGVMGLRRLTMFAAMSNTGSKSLAQSAGFREFGTQQLAASSAGVFEDLIGFELLRD